MCLDVGYKYKASDLASYKYIIILKKLFFISAMILLSVIYCNFFFGKNFISIADYIFNILSLICPPHHHDCAVSFISSYDKSLPANGFLKQIVSPGGLASSFTSIRNLIPKISRTGPSLIISLSCVWTNSTHLQPSPLLSLLISPSTSIPPFFQLWRGNHSI